MSVSLPPELERLIHDKVEAGLYPSASEVVREALHLLEERDKLRTLRFEEVREAIQIGIQQADRREVAPLDARGTLAKNSRAAKRQRRSGLMPRVFRTDQAQRDLEEILDYLDARSDEAADRFAVKLDQACELHARNPRIGASGEARTA